jgi:hypothetical protein
VVVQRLRIQETIDAAQLEETLSAPQAGAAAQGIPSHFH